MNRLLIVLLGIIFLAACSGKSSKPSDTPTSGNITITVDEALKPLIEAEVAAFESIYANAHIRVIYTSEEEAIALMLKDSARATIVSRKLVPEEAEILTKQQYKPRQLKVATSAIALIVNNNNGDTTISMGDLKKILSGEIQSWGWNHPPKKGNSAGMEVVFDQPNSGILRHLKDSVIRFDTLQKNWFALKGNSEVIDYVSKKPEALGLIDVSWISDRDDSTANKFLDAVRVVRISEDSGSYQPYQAYIAQGRYPLKRDVVMISREAKSGLASGFMSFIAGEKGQRVVLKAGLVPATMPVRIVEINRDPISISPE
ncbi:substrate-binding domain-containing protein [Chryseolinea sp. T2]|uniref:PstS family phosphate ABC transporter substrate-binding protein n=1 Tax=Chryseolinea sp. T2 TaxID=3129255 RepID=UPI0030788C41